MIQNTCPPHCFAQELTAKAVAGPVVGVALLCFLVNTWLFVTEPQYTELLSVFKAPSKSAWDPSLIPTEAIMTKGFSFDKIRMMVGADFELMRQNLIDSMPLSQLARMALTAPTMNPHPHGAAQHHIHTGAPLRQSHVANHAPLALHTGAPLRQSHVANHAPMALHTGAPLRQSHVANHAPMVFVPSTGVPQYPHANGAAQHPYHGPFPSQDANNQHNVHQEVYITGLQPSTITGRGGSMPTHGPHVLPPGTSTFTGLLPVETSASSAESMSFLDLLDLSPSEIGCVTDLFL